MQNHNKFWGSSAWKTIHSYAASYSPTENNKKAFIAFMNSQVYLLPCDKCKQHLRDNLKLYPIEKYLNNNNDLFLWTYIFHDTVNRSINKKSPCYDSIKKKYFDALGKECSDCRVK